MKVNVGREGDRLSIEPETDFEVQFLASMFLNTSNRKVVVKSGSNPSDIVCIDVVAQKTSVAAAAVVLGPDFDSNMYSPGTK